MKNRYYHLVGAPFTPLVRSWCSWSWESGGNWLAGRPSYLGTRDQEFRHQEIRSSEDQELLKASVRGDRNGKPVRRTNTTATTFTMFGLVVVVETNTREPEKPVQENERTGEGLCCSRLRATPGRGGGRQVPVSACGWRRSAPGARRSGPPQGAAGKRAQRFLAASSVSVIREGEATTGASVRLADVVLVHPYSPAAPSGASGRAATAFPARGAAPGDERRRPCTHAESGKREGRESEC